MGNTRSEQNLDFVMDNYKLLREQTRLKILQEKNSNQTFALKQDCYVVKAEFDNNLKNLSKRGNNTLQCQNILQMVKLWSKQHNGICSNIFKIFTVYEYPRVKLIDEIEARKKQNKLFQEFQLFSILQSCLNALAADSRYINISPHLIFIIPEGVLKVIHYDLIDPNYRFMFNNQYYYSPQKISNFSQINQSFQMNQKQSVFSLAMTILHSALLSSVDHCYEVSLKKFNNRKLQILLSQLTQLYSSSLCQLLAKMLQITPHKRINFDQVQSQVNEYFNSRTPSEISDSKSRRIDLNRSVQLGSKHQQSSLVFNGETFIMNEDYANKLVRKQSQFTSNTFQQESIQLPKTHQLKHLYNNKQNMYTDPKIIQLIKSGINLPQQINSRRSFNESAMRSNPSQVMVASFHDPLLGNKQRLLHSKDKLSEYEGISDQKQKCVYIVQTYQDQSHFEGMMLNGLKNGYGKLIYPDGVFYEGNFKNDTLHGKGCLYYGLNRPAYIGDWQNNRFHGRGTLYNQFPVQMQENFNYKNFNKLGQKWIKYQGNFVQDIKQGEGKITLTNGQSMEGHFSKGLLNGRCNFNCLNGQVVVGEWKNNILIQ